MSTRITQVDFGETHLLRVEQFEEDWPLSITVTYEEDQPRSARSIPSLDSPSTLQHRPNHHEINFVHLGAFPVDRHSTLRPAGRLINLGDVN